MVSHSLKLFLIGFVFTSLISCRCDKQIDCPALSNDYRSMLNYNVGDSLVFINDLGDNIVFHITSKSFSEPKTLGCIKSELGGCQCPLPGDCPTSGSFSAFTNDSSREINDEMNNRTIVFNELFFEVSGVDWARVNCWLIDSRTMFTIEPLGLDEGLTEIKSFSAGKRTYSDVIVNEIDTAQNMSSNPAYDTKFIWKTYINKEFGLIAFYDLKTNSLFYLK